MRAFLDTSSLIKLYHLETGALALRAQLLGEVEIVVTQLAWVESTSAFGRIVRRGELTAAIAAVELGNLRSDWPHFQVIQVNEAIFLTAAALLEKHTALALRSLDALQLACALAGGPLDAFFTHDQRLAGAARAEGLPVR